MSPGLTPLARRDWLRLARSEGVGAVTFDQLIRRYAEPGRALEALPELARRGGGKGAPTIPSADEIEAELAAGEALGAQLICACEASYPQALAALDPPPPVLWARGHVTLLHRSLLAIPRAPLPSAAAPPLAPRATRLGSADLAEAGAFGHPHRRWHAEPLGVLGDALPLVAAGPRAPAPPTGCLALTFPSRPPAIRISAVGFTKRIKHKTLKQWVGLSEPSWRTRLPSIGIKKFTGIEGTSSSRSLNATSIRSWVASPIPTIKPLQVPMPWFRAASRVATRSA